MNVEFMVGGLRIALVLIIGSCSCHHNNKRPSLAYCLFVVFLSSFLCNHNNNNWKSTVAFQTVPRSTTPRATRISPNLNNYIQNKRRNPLLMFKPTPAVPVSRRFDNYYGRNRLNDNNNGSNGISTTTTTVTNGGDKTRLYNAGHDDLCPLEEEYDDNGNDSSRTLHECLLHEGWDLADPKLLTVTKIYKATLESLRSRYPSSNVSNRRLQLHIPQPPPPYLANGTMDEHYQPPQEERQHQPHGRDHSSHPTNPPKTKGSSIKVESHVVQMDYPELLTDNDIVLMDTVRNPQMQAISRAFVRAGPRSVLHFDPKTVNAAIVTCGGLCPGLNNVIRELTRTLYYMYDAHHVWGIRGGFHGFHDLPEYQPVLLTDEMVQDIHHEGGTILRSSRGGFDIDKIIQFLHDKKIDHLYVIGGDGTHRGAYRIHQECTARNLNIAVAGIPKTIDNDVDYIDRSFGFLTSVEAAQASIRTAKIEAQSTMPNGCTVVKLMGRSAGFLAAVSALGSGDVDCLLVPEVPIVLDGPNGILPFLRKRIQEQKYAVVVVAEGAGEDLLGQSTQVDKGGNRKLPPIGEYIQQAIKDHFAQHGEESTVRYIDPSYTVRSNPANAVDTVYCTQLAQNAVHGAMAGYTGFSVGLVNNEMVYLPIPQLVASSPRNMNPHGPTWEAVLAMTGQPNHAPNAAAKTTTHGSSANGATNGSTSQQSIPRHEIAVP